MIRETLTHQTKVTKLKMMNNEITAVLKSDDTKTGLRLYADNCIGVAGAIGQADEQQLLDRAKRMLDFRVPYAPAPTENAVKSMDYAKHPISDEELLNKTQSLMDKLRKNCPNFSYTNVIRMDEEIYRLQNSVGTDLQFKQRYLDFSLVIKHKDSKGLMDSSAIVVCRDLADEDALYDSCSAFYEAYEQPVELSALQCDEEKVPVIFYADMDVHRKFLTDLNGKLFGSGTSLFSGKIGEKLFNDQFTLAVDRNPETCFDCFFDGEGTFAEHGENVLIQNGVLQMPYATKKIALQYGFPNAAVASMLYDAVPDIKVPFFRLGESGKSLAQLLNGQRAIFVDISGGGDYTPQGEFACPVQAAYVFDGTRFIGRLPQISLSSHINDIYGDDFIGVTSDGYFKNTKFQYFVAKLKATRIGDHT